MAKFSFYLGSAFCWGLSCELYSKCA